tara:strand:- start:32458 stop:32601 length:144 start_codon:yes stop_codon:yes gene_type:complete
MTDTEKPRTVKVRIAVAVDPYGMWEITDYPPSSTQPTHIITEGGGDA